VIDDDPAPCARQQFGDGGADAAGRTGDDCYFAR
jgi:hypothetical protein